MIYNISLISAECLSKAIASLLAPADRLMTMMLPEHIDIERAPAFRAESRHTEASERHARLKNIARHL